MNWISFVFQASRLFLDVLTAVHEQQEKNGNARGAEKSASVLATVTPIAEVIGANEDGVRALIDGAVSLFKNAKIGAFSGDAGSQVAP